MNLEISENERLFLIFSLGCAKSHSLGTVEPYASAILSLYERVVALDKKLPPSKATPAVEGSLPSVVGRSAEPGRGNPPSTTPNGGTETAKAILAPGTKPILWADGKAKPDAACRRTVILGVIRKDAGSKPRLLIKTANETISLWDKKLFDSVASKVNILWTYYTTTSADGKYTNLVGMEKP